MTIYVEHKGKKYPIQEPTIKMWSEVVKLKDVFGEEEMNLRLMEKVVGISREELEKTDATLVRKIADQINRIIDQEGKELSSVIEHQGRTYTLVNIDKISFGQFVDIDTFLNRDENYRVSNLHELATYLYTEVGVEYKNKDFKAQMKSFEDLPVRHIEGALFFLSTLGNTLVELTKVYSKSAWKWRVMKTRILFNNIGVGIRQLVHLPKTKFGRLMMWLISPLLVVLTILLILWTLIKNKKRK